MIETERLRLVPCELSHFEGLLDDPPRLAGMPDVSIVPGWAEFPEAIGAGYEHLKAHPEVLGWWTYLFIHKGDDALVGVGGFKGAPDPSGMVEIGYSIAPAYRNRGLATEAARGMIQFAFSHPNVQIVDAHTLAQVNSSTKILELAGMKLIETLHHPRFGDIWHWRLSRADYQPHSERAW